MQRVRWMVVLGAIVVALAVAALPQGDSVRTPEERVTHLAKQIRCPTCAGRSVEESLAPLAVSSKQEISTRVQRGESDEQIRAFFVSRYGDTALMSPERTGINRVPWILPILFAVAGGGLLVFAVRRWKGQEVVDAQSPTEDDRKLVEAALRGRS
jgi:cytochrome c-type biogenesis protein CcmH